jgi:glycosyltransferase involved in cell wall biosynthesis
MTRLGIVVDRLDSGLGIAALGRAEFDRNIEVIPALKFPTLNLLVRALEYAGYDDLLFSWRYILDEIFLSGVKLQPNANLLTKTRIGVLVPDYQGVDPSRQKLTLRESQLLDRVDFYHVTNVELARIYKMARGSHKFSGVLHDVTSSQEIEISRTKNFQKKDQIIWIGNSKWGIHSGYIDYKGFKRVVEPLMDRIQTAGKKYSFEIIDLALGRKSHQDVLDKIAESSILIVTSDSEGTSLPILEAVGLGTFVISTRVGIASEILNNPSIGKTVEQNCEDFFLAIEERMSQKITYSNREFQEFEKYIQMAQSESINPQKLSGRGMDINSKFRFGKYKVKVRWLYRFLTNLK